MGITFATDMGVVSTLAYTAWICRRAWQTEPPFSRRMVKVYGGCVLGCAGAGLGMVTLINLYNLLVGGPFVLRSCFFPFLGSELAPILLQFRTDVPRDYFSALQMILPQGNYSWLYVLALFFAAVLWGLCDTRLLKIGGGPTGELMFLFGVMGLGKSSYYLNRASFGNLFLILPEAVLCMGLLAEAVIPAWRRPAGHKSVWQALGLGVALSVFLELTSLAGMTLTCTTQALHTRAISASFSMQPLADLAAQVEAAIPKDTYAFGYFTQDVYACLGWDPGYHMRDAADIYAADSSALVEELNRQPAVLLYRDQTDFLLPDTPLVQRFGIPAENPYFYFYSR